MPSMTGIRTSIKMTSGLARRAASTASAPLPASPTTVKPGVAAMIPQKPTRTRAWSSATTTRIGRGTGHALPAGSGMRALTRNP